MAKNKFTAIGGQALIEGIMMKSPEKTAMAVRKKDGEIDISYPVAGSIREKYKILAIPVIRGIVGFVESMIQGYKAMMLSADISGFTDLDDGEQTPKDQKKDGILMTVIMIVATILGFALAIGLFMFIPRMVVGGIEKLAGFKFPDIARSTIEQAIKLAVFVLYVWAVAFMKDIKRVFQYHGAEHKTIFCYEKGLPLTVENVRKQKRFHPRCGTSFMILMILISIFFSTLAQILFKGVYENALVWTLVKILMLPIICGAGFEVLRACGKFDNLLTRIISAPGLWLQRITTKEPDDGMIEIAIAALRACEPETPDVDRSIDETQAETEETPDEHI